jgi:hypothetical protein
VNYELEMTFKGAVVAYHKIISRIWPDGLKEAIENLVQHSRSPHQHLNQRHLEGEANTNRLGSDTRNQRWTEATREEC